MVKNKLAGLDSKVDSVLDIATVDAAMEATHRGLMRHKKIKEAIAEDEDEDDESDEQQDEDDDQDEDESDDDDQDADDDQDENQDDQWAWQQFRGWTEDEWGAHVDGWTAEDFDGLLSEFKAYVEEAKRRLGGGRLHVL